MKIKLFFIFSLLSIIFCACNSDDVIDVTNKKGELNMLADNKTDTADIIPAAKDSLLMKALRARSTRSLQYNSPYDSYDNYFQDNIYQLRDMALTIQARGTGNRSNRFFSCDGINREVYLAPSAICSRQWFHLRILPAVSGIPYMIYSDAAGTPLTVGSYKSNPNVKVLYAPSNDNGSLFMKGWDLIAADYQGYFGITNCDYLGQADPKNSWSVFNYALEAQNENKIGYSQYTKKAQQEFLIQPKDDFTVDYIEFDKSTASVSKGTPLEVVTNGKNETEERRPFTITAALYVTNQSSFSEKSWLKIPFKESVNFYCPKVEAEHLIFPAPVRPEDEPQKSDFECNIKYTNLPQRVNKLLTFDINGTAKPNSEIEVTSWLENYNVSADYIVHMSFRISSSEVRTVKIKGTWHGIICTAKRAKPDIVKFFDLDDGGELNMVKKSIKNYSKTILTIVR